MGARLKGIKVVSGGHVSSIGEVESAEFEWNRNLSYDLLREGAVEVVKIDCLL